MSSDACAFHDDPRSLMPPFFFKEPTVGDGGGVLLVLVLVVDGFVKKPSMIDSACLLSMTDYE